jgi:RNA polymerase sigma-70 factor (ECF subfamily)
LDPTTADALEVERGDTAAFRRIVDRTQGRLVRLALRIVGDQDEAEDAVQESYVKAHEALSSGRFDHRCSAETWLYRIVTRTAIDAARKTARSRRLSLALQAPGPGTSAEARFELSELSGWLEELPKDQHAVLLLKAVEGFSSKEIAEILECSEGAVEQRLVRARAALRCRAEGSGPRANRELLDLFTGGAAHVPA